jgi:hypothetical protein
MQKIIATVLLAEPGSHVPGTWHHGYLAQVDGAPVSVLLLVNRSIDFSILCSAYFI